MQDDFDLPSARKGQSNDPPSAPFNPGGSPWSAPLSPDHMPPSAEYDPASGPWGYGGSGTPYGAPSPGYAPPPPPRRGATSPQGRRNRGLLLALLALLVTGTFVGAFLFFTHEGGSTTSSTPNTGPVAVATDKPTPTATLKPGQTPLPTKVPTATPQPTAPPGQPTYTPVPTSTPIPYASSASVHFTASTKAAPAISSTVLAATSGGDISATVESASSVAGSATESQDSFPAQPATYALTVQNTANFSLTSSGQTVHSTGGIACALQGSLTVPAHTTSSTKQNCITSPGAQPANVSFNDSTSNPPFVYSGGPFPAGGSDEYYQVPADCATNAQNISDAQAADATKISQALASQTPSNSAAPFYTPANTYSGLTCNPVAGTQTTTSTPQTYTVSLTGSGTQTTYVPQQAINVQSTRLQNAVNGLPPTNSWRLISPHICGAPSVQSHTATSATLSCSASGTAQWIWSNSAPNTNNQLTTLANLINGESKSSAVAALKSVQGIVSSSVSITLTGGSFMPKNPGSITFVVS